MLLEGFYGNTLLDVEFDICKLPAATQTHIMTQWTRVQAELATLTYPQIGSICSVSETGEPVIGKLAAYSVGEIKDPGPFSTATEYFTAIANASIDKQDPSVRLGAHVFGDILSKTTLFEGSGSFPLNHMDLGTQNILVNDDFDFIAIIDWEFAQTAPWQVNHYPMPFPLLDSDIETILRDPSHLAYRNVSRQDSSRRIYDQKFQEAESELEKQGRTLERSFPDILNGPASRIYACFTNLGRLPASDEGLLLQMVQLACGLGESDAKGYLQEMEQRVSGG